MKYILEIVVFVCGAVVMIFELVGSRILGPYFGTSIFIWTSIMGIILGSLSLGYYLGGKLADKKPSEEFLSLIIFLAAFSIILTYAIKDMLLGALQFYVMDIRIGSVIGSIALFFPTSLLLGFVSPYAVKLKLNNLNISGSTVGNLYAISTTGSIIGTFISGFYLIPQFGTNKLLIILAIILVLVSLSLSLKKYLETKLIVTGITILILMSVSFPGEASIKKIDVDTPYNRVWIYDYIDRDTNRVTKIMGINNENHSSMYLDSDELVNEYTKFYDLAKHFKPDFTKTLMLGGAGYSYPKSFLLKYSNATIDVIEIDPKITELAREYFRLRDDPRLKIYNEDARVYLNRTDKKYDVIFGDAFSSKHSLPYHLTTKETVEKKFNILNEDGVVILNIISSIKGDKGEFLRAEYKTYKSVFPQVYLFPVQFPRDAKGVQNIILVALKSNKEYEMVSKDPVINEYLKHLWTKEINNDMPILTDDFAPVDSYIGKTI